MKTLEEIKEILVKQKPLLRRKYGVKTLGVFGSFLKGRQKKKSDLDILVEIDDPITLLEFVRMENYLSELTGMKIDLVMKDALKPRIGKHILHEVVTL
jgi:predicted nucleotidyltransferase